MEDKIKTIVIDGVDFSFNLEMAYEKDGHVYCRRCKEKIDSDPLNCLGNKKILFRRKCKCDREEESLRKAKEEADHIRRLREECFITSKNLISCTFDKVIAPDRQEVIIAKNFVKNFKELSKNNNGLIFHGNVGTGKTYLAACIANKIIEEDWIKVEGTHEAIVTETMFNVANKMMGRDILNRESKPEFLTGLLYCADCGNQLVRRNQKTKSGQTIYYICGLYNRGKGCSRHSIREEDILSSLNYILKQHIKYQEELFLRIRQTDFSKSEYDLDLDDLLAEKKKYETLRRSLYMDLEDELIDEE